MFLLAVGNRFVGVLGPRQACGQNEEGLRGGLPRLTVHKGLVPEHAGGPGSDWWRPAGSPHQVHPLQEPPPRRSLRPVRHRQKREYDQTGADPRCSSKRDSFLVFSHSFVRSFIYSFIHSSFLFILM